MLRRQRYGLVALVAVFVGGFGLGTLVQQQVARAQSKNKLYELRMYTTNDGMMGAVEKRMHDYNLPLMTKHGMKVVGMFKATDPPRSPNTWVYILEHPDRAAADKNWAAFRSDPDWQKALKETDAAAGGRTIKSTETFFIAPADFSPMK